jgi:general secretion pathway protein G
MKRNHSSHRTLGQPSRPAFTLIEILIVVIILGILAAIVLPQFSNASTEARESTMRDCLRYMRTQLTVYKAQHRDVAPGYPGGNSDASPDAATFIIQMTGFSDEGGNVSAAPDDVHHFGPYLTRMPGNPFSNQNGVLVVTGSTMPSPDSSQPYGWIYNPELLQFIANQPGSDSSGTSYASY